MPNPVTNILRVSGDGVQVRAMFEAIKNDMIGLGSIDFNKVIPTVKNIYQGNLGQTEQEKYGKNNWLDWNIANWGTKWNIYGYHEFTTKEFDGEQLAFQTAWGCADKVVSQLAEQYPDLTFQASQP